MIEIFSKFNREALDALQKRYIPRVRASDYFNKSEGAGADADQELERWDSYLSQFAKMADVKCLCCGKHLNGRIDMEDLGISFGGFEWGLVHGEGHCTYCGYPMRGHHNVEGLGSIRNLYLPYHPSALSFGPEDKT